MSSAKPIQVFVRTKPSNSFASDNIVIADDLKSLQIQIPRDLDKGHINNQTESWAFQYKKVLHNVSQEQVFDESAAHLVNGAFQGYNGTLLAYGQTGAGKTFTITGSTENYKNRGMIPRAISKIFDNVKEHPENAYTIRVSYMEIYNEQVMDLLNINPDSKVPLLVFEEDNVCHVKGLKIVLVNSEEECMSLLFEGEANRAIAEHQMNRNSSRSHCIFTFCIESRSRDDPDQVIEAKLNFVDLAGSERVSKTKTEGIQLREAMYINKSLSILEQVIMCLGDKSRDHIPYRRSKLTTLLRDTLGGNCNTMLMANIWGEKSHLNETISTLKFSSRMMCVTTLPTVNVQKDPSSQLKKLEKLIQDLKQELAIKDRLLSQKNVQYEAFTQQEKDQLLNQIKAYTCREIEEIEIPSLRFAKELAAQFRNYCMTLEKDIVQLKSRKHKSAVLPIDLRQEDPVEVVQKPVVAPVEVKTAAPAPVPETTKDTKAAAGAKEKEKEAPSKQAQPKTGVNSILANVPADSQLAALLTGSVATQAPAAAAPASSTTTAAPPAIIIDAKKDTLGVSGAGANIAQPSASTIPAMAPSPIIPTFASSGASALVVTSSMNYLNLGGDGGSSKNGVLISKDEAYVEFRQGKGLEMDSNLKENKAKLHEKKTQAKATAERMNGLKLQIDEIKSTLVPRATAEVAMDLDGFPVADEEDIQVVDEEEKAKVDKLEHLTEAYRDEAAKLRQLRSEIDYCDKLVFQCRQRIFHEFESWYVEEYMKDNNKGNRDVGPQVTSTIFFKAKAKNAKQSTAVI